MQIFGGIASHFEICNLHFALKFIQFSKDKLLRSFLICPLSFGMQKKNIQKGRITWR